MLVSVSNSLYSPCQQALNLVNSKIFLYNFAEKNVRQYKYSQRFIKLLPAIDSTTSAVQGAAVQ